MKLTGTFELTLDEESVARLSGPTSTTLPEPDQEPSFDLVDAIEKARPGEVITLSAGEFFLRSPVHITSPDVTIIGAGSGLTTIIGPDSSDPMFTLGERGQPLRGLTIRDITFQAADNAEQSCLQAGGRVVGLQVIGCRFVDFHRCVLLHSSILRHYGVAGYHQDVRIEGCYFMPSPINAYGAFLEVDTLRIANCEFDSRDDASRGHLCRIAFGQNVEISDCHFRRAPQDRHALKIHGPTIGKTSGVRVLGCSFTGSARAPWTVTVGPQDAGRYEFVEDVLFENCMFVGPAQAHLMIWSIDTTVRACSFYGYARPAVIEDRGSGPVPTRITFEGNVFEHQQPWVRVPVGNVTIT